MQPLPPRLLEHAVIGNLLGDAWMERKSPTANARLGYSQMSPGHDAQFFYVWRFYALYCNGYAYYRERLDKRTGYLNCEHSFKTRAIPFFTRYYELFYVNNVKTIPLNIASYLTPVAVAFWVMDDGGLNGGLCLNTQGFTVAGIDLLVDALNVNYNISYRRREKQHYIIYVPKADLRVLTPLLLPYMHPSTYYKLGL